MACGDAARGATCGHAPSSACGQAGQEPLDGAQLWRAYLLLSALSHVRGNALGWGEGVTGEVLGGVAAQVGGGMKGLGRLGGVQLLTRSPSDALFLWQADLVPGLTGLSMQCKTGCTGAGSGRSTFTWVSV